AGELPLATTDSESKVSGWWSLDALPAPTWDGKTLLFQGDKGNLAITPLSDDVVRVRFTAAKMFGRDHSYAVINENLGAPAAKAEVGADSNTLTTASLKVIVQNHPLRIEFQNAAGESLDADDPGQGLSFAGDAFRLSKRLRGDEHIYGF